MFFTENIYKYIYIVNERLSLNIIIISYLFYNLCHLPSWCEMLILFWQRPAVWPKVVEVEVEGGRVRDGLLSVLSQDWGDNGPRRFQTATSINTIHPTPTQQHYIQYIHMSGLGLLKHGKLEMVLSCINRKTSNIFM